MGQDRRIEQALAQWRQAQEQESAHRYFLGLGKFLSFLAEHPDTSVQHACGVMGRECAGLLARTGSGREAIEQARLALVSAHLADPAQGDPARVRQVLAEPGSPMRQLMPDLPVPTVVQLVEAAAESRSLLAGLLRQFPAASRAPGQLWPVGSGGRWWSRSELRRRHRAVLPSCAGLVAADEADQLVAEAARIWAALG